MYKQLTYRERCHIEIYLQEAYSLSHIARQLNRARSTVRSEIERHSKCGCYCAELAQTQAQKTKLKQRREARGISTELWRRVDRHIKQRWSPEQISGVLKNEGIALSHEWIYQHIWHDKAHGGDLFTYLRRHGKKYQKRSSGAGRGVIRNRVDIDERPEVVETKSRVGDWEGDLVLGKVGTGAAVTLVERKTRFTKLGFVQQKSAPQTNVAILKAFKPIPTEVLCTLTFDNGKEFAWHEHLTNALGIDVYFAKPYHSWERGLNENTNGLLRQYLPKGSSFEDLTPEHLQWIEDELNDRPRKCLGFKTPRQMMEIELAA